MADLADCYFCGSIDELERRPVIPPELGPSEENQRRVVVCPTCGEKLDRVVEPLLAHVDAAGGGPEDGGEGASDAPEGGEGASDAPDGGTDASEGDADEADGEDDAGEDEGGDDDDVGEDESRDDDEKEGRDEDEGGDSDEDGTEETDETGAVGHDGTDDEDADGTVELPAETRDILRLLGNREFPIEREKILAVASSAYDVRYEEADAVIDALIKRDQLAEREGTLYRPE